MLYRILSFHPSIKRGIAMPFTRDLLAVAVCATACSQAQALMSINVLQDDTTVPGWIINTFTVDSDTDVMIATALSDLSSGSILDLPGFFPQTASNGPGDSFVTINGNRNTSAGLSAGDLGGASTASLNSSRIDLTWYTTNTDDIGLGMHVATFTFSDDAQGVLSFGVLASGQQRYALFTIADGVSIMDKSSTYLPFTLWVSRPPVPPIPDPPLDTDPLPDPDPDPDPGNDPPDPGLPDVIISDGGNNPIPEPAGLGLLGLCAALIGGLHRRRPGVDAK